MHAFSGAIEGETPTDHHTFFILSLMDSRMALEGQPMNPQLSHASFEVANLMTCGEATCGLKTKAEYLDERYEIAWGVGRHVLGSTSTTTGTTHMATCTSICPMEIDDEVLRSEDSQDQRSRA